MDINNLPDKCKLAEETADAIWVYPMLEDGTYSTKKIKLADKGKQNDSLIFARTAWANANAYLKAAIMLKGESTNDGHLLLPATVQSAFACEVYLKSIIYPVPIQYAKPRDKHDLKNLFSQIPKNLKEKVYYYLVPPNTITTFELVLSDNADMLLKLRYVHEQCSFQFNLDFLIWFASALKQVSKGFLGV